MNGKAQNAEKAGPSKRLLAILILILVVSTGATVMTFVFYFIGGAGPARLTMTALVEGRDALPSPATSFATLLESDIPGRYKWISGEKARFIVLYPDHTFMNEDGTIYPIYRWEVTPEHLSLRWQGSVTVFTNFEAPGVYTGAKVDGAMRRMEKQPPYDASDLAPKKPVATLRFGVECETNGLTPVNTGGDGAIYATSIHGEDCYRLVRKESRPTAYLYLQIAPEIKESPFTNALVLVEYFDAAPADGRLGRLAIQYDSEAAPYSNVQPLTMAGSETWQEATFYVARPLFQKRQNDGGDFRVCTSTSELLVRSVKLVKNVPLPEVRLPISRSR